jgi:hypothetical protein
MKRTYWVAIIAVCLGLGLTVISVPTVSAGDNSLPKVFVYDRDVVVNGRTFSEWSAEWNQWSYSFPVPQHPLFDNADCTAGQSGPVWFLGGKFCANNAVCSYTAVRSCTVPFGKKLFFPVVDFEDSALEQQVVEHPGDLAYQQIGALRYNTSSVEGATDIFCQIDGVNIPNLAQRFTVQSVPFGFTLPDKNLLSAIYGVPFEAGTYFPAVDDGYYMMLSLSPGKHTLHFGASWLDVTYHITVVK